MFTGVHILFYTTDPEADRAFMRDVLGFPAVDSGGGWLILKLPPAEAGVHPLPPEAGAPPAVHGLATAQVFLMCADIEATVAQLSARGAACSARHTESWGISTSLSLPSGALLGLYQPLHATALGL